MLMNNPAALCFTLAKMTSETMYRTLYLSDISKSNKVKYNHDPSTVFVSCPNILSSSILGVHRVSTTISWCTQHNIQHDTANKILPIFPEMVADKINRDVTGLIDILPVFVPALWDRMNACPSKSDTSMANNGVTLANFWEQLNQESRNEWELSFGSSSGSYCPNSASTCGCCDRDGHSNKESYCHLLFR